MARRLALLAGMGLRGGWVNALRQRYAPRVGFGGAPPGTKSLGISGANATIYETANQWVFDPHEGR